VVRKHVTLHGSWAWTKDDYNRAIELVASGKIDRKPLVSHTYPLSAAPEAFAMQAQPTASVKVLLKP